MNHLSFKRVAAIFFVALLSSHTPFAEGYLNPAAAPTAVATTSLPETDWQTSDSQAAFANTALLPAFTGVVPTVVEVPFAGPAPTTKTFLVVDATTGIAVPSVWYESTQTVRPAGTIVGSDGRSLNRLYDDSLSTSETFPLQNSSSNVVTSFQFL